MDEARKVRINVADKSFVGERVKIVQATEPTSEIRLADGTLLRLRTVALKVTRLDDQWDNEGNPIYVVTSSNVMSAEDVPERYMRRVN